MFTNEELKAQLITLKENCITTILALAKFIPAKSIAVVPEIVYDSFPTPNDSIFREHIFSINPEDKTVMVDSIHGHQPVPLINLKITLLFELVEYLEKSTELVR